MTLYPGSYQYEPMKYNGKPAQSIVDAAFKGDGTWIAQEKKDGALYQLEKIDNDHIYLFARTRSRKTGELVEKSANVPHIIDWAKDNLPDDTIVIGEIYVEGGKSNNVTSIMGCTPINAVTRQFGTKAYGGPVSYYIFDCIRLNGEDLINKGFAERWNAIYKEIFWHVNDYVRYSETYTENFEEALQRIFMCGGEGLVFKKADAIYEPGKRPTRTYFKMKEHLDSIDLICIGLEDPVKEYSGKEIKTWQYWLERGEQYRDGSFQWYPLLGIHYQDHQNNPHIYQPVTKPYFYGWKNAMVLGAYKDDKVVEVGRVASGLTDSLREDMAKHPEKYLDHVVEVEAMSTTKDGALRHPVFRRMRNDKDKKDCQYAEIFGQVK